jgi:hypothetical protein
MPTSGPMQIAVSDRISSPALTVELGALARITGPTCVELPEAATGRRILPTEGCVWRVHLRAPSEKTGVQSRFTPAGLLPLPSHIASLWPPREVGFTSSAC